MLTPNVVRWQWQSYSTAHRNRKNLLVHALTVPIFVAGTVLLVVGLGGLDPPLSLVGAVAMAGAMAAQGRGHRTEATPPAPFRSPFDVVVRIFVEQLVTFPRFVLSGRFARAWRESGFCDVGR